MMRKQHLNDGHLAIRDGNVNSKRYIFFVQSRALNKKKNAQQADWLTFEDSRIAFFFVCLLIYLNTKALKFEAAPRVDGKNTLILCDTRLKPGKNNPKLKTQLTKSKWGEPTQFPLLGHRPETWDLRPETWTLSYRSVYQAFSPQSTVMHLIIL